MGLRIVVNQAAAASAHSTIHVRTNNFVAIPFLAPCASSWASRLFLPRASSVFERGRSGDVRVHGESKGNIISSLRGPPKQ
jgi:hypothetical protein